MSKILRKTFNGVGGNYKFEKVRKVQSNSAIILKVIKKDQIKGKNYPLPGSNRVEIREIMVT